MNKAPLTDYIPPAIKEIERDNWEAVMKNVSDARNVLNNYLIPAFAEFPKHPMVTQAYEYAKDIRRKLDRV